MNNKININISKDTPAEIITALCAAIKTQGKEPKQKQPLYALNEDIEQLHKRYEDLFKQVKNSLNLSADQIEKECETLSRKYDFELEELSQMRKVDYDKRQAEIKAKAAEETPWRRGWWWRLLFKPLTNRAQDIIENRAELEADTAHTAAEKQIEDDRKKRQDNAKSEKTPPKTKKKTRVDKDIKPDSTQLQGQISITELNSDTK